MKNLLILFILAFSLQLYGGPQRTCPCDYHRRTIEYRRTCTQRPFAGLHQNNGNRYGFLRQEPTSICRIAQNRTDGKFRPFWPKSKRRAKPNTWGYDAITYYWLEQWWQEPFYVIKWAIGGTSIEPSNASDKSIHWSANPEWLANNTATSEKGRSLLLSFINDIDGCIDNTLSKLKNGYQIDDAFLWHQGESDHAHGDKYYENLKAVVTYVRNHLSEKTGKDYPTYLFIFGTVAKKNKQYGREVEAAMKRFAKEDKNAYLIDMSDAELMGDRLHFNQNSAEYLGKQMYEQIKAIR